MIRPSLCSLSVLIRPSHVHVSLAMKHASNAAGNMLRIYCIQSSSPALHRSTLSHPPAQCHVLRLYQIPFSKLVLPQPSTVTLTYAPSFVSVSALIKNYNDLVFLFEYSKLAGCSHLNVSHRREGTLSFLLLVFSMQNSTQCTQNSIQVLIMNCTPYSFSTWHV